MLGVQGMPVVMIVEVASKGVHPLQLLSVSPQLPWGAATPLTGLAIHCTQPTTLSPQTTALSQLSAHNCSGLIC